MREGSWTAQYTIHADANAGQWLNMPTGTNFLFSSPRHIVAVDVNGMTYVRLKVNRLATAANSGSKFVLKYSPTYSTDPASYIDIGTSEVSVLVDTPNTYLMSNWIPLNNDCRVYDDIYLAVISVTGSGNGNADPEFGNISVGFC
jgi:hypothetical protein